MMTLSNRLSDFVTSDSDELGRVPRSYKDILKEELIEFHSDGRELDSVLRKRAENMAIKDGDIV